jgi:hypothetical protein
MEEYNHTLRGAFFGRDDNDYGEARVNLFLMAASYHSKENDPEVTLREGGECHGFHVTTKRIIFPERIEGLPNFWGILSPHWIGEPRIVMQRGRDWQVYGRLNSEEFRIPGLNLAWNSKKELTVSKFEVYLLPGNERLAVDRSINGACRYGIVEPPEKINWEEYPKRRELERFLG